MAIERTGSISLIQSSSDPSSDSVTVPADATLAVLFVSGWSNTANWLGSGATITLNSVGFTVRQDTSNNTNPEQIALWTLVDPATGSQTLAWDLGDTPSSGAEFVVVYYKGVDTADLIRDSGKSEASEDVTGLSASAGNMLVGGVACDSAITSVNDDSQTQVSLAGLYNSNYMGIGEELSEGDFYSTVAGGSPSSVAIVLKPAGAGPEALTISDGVKFGESSTLTRKGVLTALDGIKFGDSVVAVLKGAVTVGDGAKFGDSLVLKNVKVLLQADGITFSDASILYRMLSLAQGDAAQFGDGAVLTGKFGITLRDGVKFGDGVLLTTAGAGRIRRWSRQTERKIL